MRNNATPHIALARKWRPQQFSQVVEQPHVVQALTNALNQNYLHHAYLFTGTRGVGKTTIARIIAKCLNCEKGVSANPCGECDTCHEIDNGHFPDLYEVDAASRTKVEDTRELLDNVQYAPTKGRYKIYLIDEVHMLSGHSFNALLKTLEEPPEHVKFLLATTDPQKLPATVLSRCLQFHLLQIAPEKIAAHLQFILGQENIPFDAEATLLLGKAADGSMRDALSLLDQSIAFGNNQVLTADVKHMLGTIEPTALYDILRALADKSGNALLQASRKLAEQGANFSRALQDLLSLLHQLTLLQIIPGYTCDDETLTELAQHLSAEDTQLFYQIGLLGQRDLALAPTPHTGFEMTLLRMLAFMPNHSNETVAISNTAQATASPSKVSIDSNDWNQIYQNANITGAAKALAQHCHLKSKTDNELVLALESKQKALLNDKYVQRIQQAVSELLQRPVKVKIELDTASSTGQTPAELEQAQQRKQQQAAEQAIVNDEKVQRIMQAFDAKIVEGSISPAGEN